jgi:hypothetical protein
MAYDRITQPLLTKVSNLNAIYDNSRQRGARRRGRRRHGAESIAQSRALRGAKLED